MDGGDGGDDAFILDGGDGDRRGRPAKTNPPLPFTFLYFLPCLSTNDPIKMRIGRLLQGQENESDSMPISFHGSQCDKSTQ